MKKKQIPKSNDKGRWYFLATVLLTTLVIYFVWPTKFFLVWKTFARLSIKTLPILLVVYLIMVIVNCLSKPNLLTKHLNEKSSAKVWLITIISGILAVGPIYMWYPLLKNLRDQGIKIRYLSAFLYNWGIKLQWAPLLIGYFGWKFSLILLIMMAIFSIPQGIFTEKMVGILKKI